MKPTTHALLITLLLVLNSCSSSKNIRSNIPTEELASIQTQTVKDIYATLTANAPSPTIKPIDTPSPTYTPTQLPTSTPTTPPEVITVDNVENIKEVFTFNTPGKEDMSLYWSSDNVRLLAQTCRFDVQVFSMIGCSQNGQNGITVFDPFTGKEIRKVPVDINGVEVLFSGNGRFISIVDNFAPYNWKGYFLDVDNGQHIGILNPNILGINDSGEIVVEDEGYGLFSAQLSSNNTIQALEVVPDILHLNHGVFSRDGTFYAQPGYINGNEYLIQLWDTTNGKALARISSLYLPPLQLSFTADGSHLIGYFYDQGIPRVDIWDSMTGETVHSIEWKWPIEFTNPLPSISPNGQLLAIPNVEIVQNRPIAVIQILNIENREILTSIPISKNNVGAVITFSGDGHWLAYALRSEDNSDQWQIHILAVAP